MNPFRTTATTVEKFNREARSRSRLTGRPLAAALDEVAVEAGYTSWKHVTECAAWTVREGIRLLPAMHRHRLISVFPRGAISIKQVKSVAELCAALGGVEPVLIRQACGESRPSYPCFCQLDPFATAWNARVALDIGDKDDSWHYLFDANNPAHSHDGWLIRATLGLTPQDHYPNEHVGKLNNDDRSNSLNPNNPAHVANADNRSMQLNPNNFRYRN